jgi:hypothetical protein
MSFKENDNYNNEIIENNGILPKEEVGVFKMEIQFLIDQAYGKLLSSKIEEPYSEDYLNEDKFINEKGYTEKEIEECKEEIKIFEKNQAQIETHSQKEVRKKSEILEYIIFEQGELGNWFGEYAHTIKVCRSDDIRNGVDIMIETRDLSQDVLNEIIDEKKFSYLGLATDVTFEKMDNAIGIEKHTPKKFQRIKDEISRGELAKINFYKSRFSSEAKRLINVPRVVLNIDSRIANELIELWVNGENEELAKHRIQVIILYQITAQLKVYEEYAKECGREAIENILKQSYEEFEEVRVQKTKEFPRHAKGLDLETMKDGYRAILKI